MKFSKSNYLKQVFSIGILISAYGGLSAQDAIQNGGFESVPNPVHYRQGTPFSSLTFAGPWTTPNDGTPDIFVDDNSACDYNACQTPASANTTTNNPNGLARYPEACVNDNAFGSEYPRTHPSGSNYNYVMLFFPEYIQEPLAYSLVAGSCYKLTMYVSRADVDANAAHIEAVLSVGNTWSTTSGQLTPPTANAVWLTTADQQTQFIENKVGWTPITFYFKATGGENYITIGHFDSDLEFKTSSPTDCGTTSVPCNSGACPGFQSTAFSSSTCYFYDDISLVPIAGSSFSLTSNHVFTNATITASNSQGSATNILLTGNNTISGDVYWDNGCQIKCNTGSTLTISSGSSLHLGVNTVMNAGCDGMWKGIVVNGTGKIIMDRATIEDAITAITINGTAGWVISGTTSQSSHFNKNVTDMIINGNSQYTNILKYTTFDHSAVLLEPLQGVNNRGVTGIIFNGSSTANNETIGGTSTGEGCIFIGGQYGIRSTNKDLTVQRSYFSGIAETAIDFQGNDPTHFRTLIVNTGTTFIHEKRCIYSQHRTNLTVQSCSLNYSTEDAIEWSDNHDGHLLIGDSLVSTKGNLFQYNAWEAVAAWDNKTTQTNPTTLATNSNDYTTICIANNHITTPSDAGGILLGEWVLGSNCSDHLLYVGKNIITGAYKGIQAYNIKGFGGVFNNPAFSVPSTAIDQNQISISTASNPLPMGVNGQNTAGLSIGANLIGSDNPLSYQNMGIRLESSEFTSVYNNGIETGTGICVQGDMASSGIYCNILQNNVVGVAVAWANLCQDNLHPHGSVAKAYSNVFALDQPASINIHDYYSPVYFNNWVWDASVTTTDPIVKYDGVSTVPSGTTPNQSTTSLITSFTGTNDCPFGSGWIIVAPGGSNNHATMSTAEAQWRADYNYEIRRLNTDSGSSSIASANIKSIIGIENNIGAGNYTDALTALGSFTPANAIEHNYKTVLTIFANINDSVKREPTTAEIDTLTAIAEQFPRTGGEAVTLARAYLLEKYNLYFKDEQITDGTANGTADITTPCSFSPAPKTSLGFMDAEGNDAGVTGTVESDGTFTFDPYELAYYGDLNPDTTYRIYSKYGSQFTVVNRDFKTLTDWISFSPFTLSMSGASVKFDTTENVPYLPIDSATSIDDGSGHIYSVSSTFMPEGKSDFLLEKRTNKGVLIWSRTYDGPVHQNDTATCITMDDNGFIYIAGKVYNGKNYDIQALKYDEDGYMQWQSVVADSSSQNNYPTGISVDSGDMTVSVLANRNSDTTTSFRYVHWGQCLPSGSRLAHIEPQSTTDAFSLIEFYPNPADNKLNIVLKNTTGGKLELFNLQGQLVFTRQITQSGEVDLPQNQVSDGLYLLKFTGAGQPQFNKLVIHHN